MEDEIIWIKIMALKVGKASWTPIVPRGHAIRVNFVRWGNWRS
jgi:hypothetical protein